MKVYLVWTRATDGSFLGEKLVRLYMSRMDAVRHVRLCSTWKPGIGAEYRVYEYEQNEFSVYLYRDGKRDHKVRQVRIEERSVEGSPLQALAWAAE